MGIRGGSKITDICSQPLEGGASPLFCRNSPQKTHEINEIFVLREHPKSFYLIRYCELDLVDCTQRIFQDIVIESIAEDVLICTIPSEVKMCLKW